MPPIDPSADTTQNFTTARTARKATAMSVHIMADPDGKGRIIVADVNFADGAVGTVPDLQFKDIGTAAQRQTVRDFLDLVYIAAVQRIGFIA